MRMPPAAGRLLQLTRSFAVPVAQQQPLVNRIFGVLMSLQTVLG